MLISYLERPIKAANGAGAREMACAAQTTEQIPRGSASHRMSPIGRDLGQRHNDERTLLEMRMRQDEAWTCRRRRPVHDPVAKRQQVEVKRPRPIPDSRSTTRITLQPLKTSQQIVWQNVT